MVGNLSEICPPTVLDWTTAETKGEDAQRLRDYARRT